MYIKARDLRLIGIIFVLCLLSQLFSPSSVVECISGNCTISSGSSQLAKFESENVKSCTIVRIVSSRRSTLRHSLRGASHSYYPEILLKNGGIYALKDIQSMSYNKISNVCDKINDEKTFKYTYK